MIGLLFGNSANQNCAFIHTSDNGIVDIAKQWQQKVKIYRFTTLKDDSLKESLENVTTDNTKKARDIAA